MLKRSLLVPALLLLPLAMALGTPGRAQDDDVAAKKGITIEAATLSPKKVTGRGGAVSVRVRVKAKRGPISAVNVRSIIKGVNGPSSELRPSGNGIYAGTVTIPRNDSKKAQTANIIVTATARNGSASKKVGTIQVEKGGSDPNEPPPPPPI